VLLLKSQSCFLVNISLKFQSMHIYVNNNDHALPNNTMRYYYQLFERHGVAKVDSIRVTQYEVNFCERVSKAVEKKWLCRNMNKRRWKRWDAIYPLEFSSVCAAVVKRRCTINNENTLTFSPPTFRKWCLFFNSSGNPTDSLWFCFMVLSTTFWAL